MHPLVVIILILIFGTVITWELLSGVACLPKGPCVERSTNPAGFWAIVLSELIFATVIGLQFDTDVFQSSDAGVKVASVIIPIVWISMVSIVVYYLKQDSSLW